MSAWEHLVEDVAQPWHAGRDSSGPCRRLRDAGRAACREWPRDTLVDTDEGPRRLPVFARCHCGRLLPVEYAECLDCNPDRLNTRMGHEERDAIKIRRGP